MNNKTTIYNKLLEMSDENGMSAQTLSLILGMSRSNVSHELNKLCKEGRIGKSTGRPVHFYPLSAQNLEKEKLSELDALIRNNTSLKQAGEQAKAAILYPPKGISTLILGDTGVGKSMFATLMYYYAVDMGILAKNSPFIIFNCADYSNNPQLLVSHLFGVKKGTFTGADTDKSGLIEQADGGVLFLDEVHRLPPEGQEALFTFMDTDTFRRMGDSSIRKSNVLIITATTEEPSSALLKTFTRRIPMTIQIPSLKERSFEERLQLIKDFFKSESIKLSREICVSSNTIRALLSYDCPGNIGQLKSDIQLLCAKAYSELLTNIRSDVRINSRSLPLYIREGLLKEKEHRMLWNKLTGEEIEYFKFSSATVENPRPQETEDNSIYEIIEKKLGNLKSKGISNIDIEHILEKDISKHFQKHIDGINDEINKTEILNLLGEEVLNCVDEVISYLSDTLNRTFSNNLYTALALHINTLFRRVNSGKSIYNPHLSKLKELYPREFDIALKAKTILENFIHRSIPDDEAGFLTIFLLPEERVHEGLDDKVRIILIAHGDSTSTSMANVANRLLGENYTIAIDMPLDVSPAFVLDQLREIVRKEITSSGCLLLVDMGSLTTFADVIANEFHIPAKAITLVSTLHVLEATRKALLGFSLDEIHKDVLLVNSYLDSTRGTVQPLSGNKKIAIISTCLTGEGGSIAVKSILNNSLKYDKDLFEIITLNSLDKNYFRQTLNKIQEERDVLFIVSSFPLDVEVRQYNMYDVISMKVMGELQESIDIKSTLVKMPMILKENIDNLDGAELYKDICHSLKILEERLAIGLKDSTLVGLILHMAFMISRMKKGEKSVEYPDREDAIQNNLQIFNTISENLTTLTEKYSITLTRDETCFILDYLLHQ